jgi:predicted  nucleic acid-binding Zn-ribbon protein
LENEVEGMRYRLDKLTAEIEQMEGDIAKNKQGIKDAEALIKKYNEQLNNVKNNREFDSLNKEIEYQTLEIQLLSKRIREAEPASEEKRNALEITRTKVSERENDLNLKRAELAEIAKETEKEEQILKAKSEEAKTKIDERLLSAYERIRSGAPNGMAVVPIEREASAGSFIQLPPQKQLDVASRKRVIVDEHSGRILVDADLAREEQEKMDALLAKELGL